MSRCRLDDEKRDTEVVIGWDPPKRSFFARVVVDGDELFWIGNGDKVYSSPEKLVEKIQPWACEHDKAELIRELRRDKLEDDGERSYDLMPPPGDADVPADATLATIAVWGAPTQIVEETQLLNNSYGTAGNSVIRRPKLPPFPAAFDACEIMVDPALGVDQATEISLIENIGVIPETSEAFKTSLYPAILAVERIANDPVRPRVLIRAATGDEALALHDAAIARTPVTADAILEWQDAPDSEVVLSDVVVLWEGEVLFNDGAQRSAAERPFYVLEEAAKAWAFHHALKFPAKDVHSVQLVSYHCATQFAQEVMDGGDEAYNRLQRFWTAPVRVQKVWPLSLPIQYRHNQ